MGLPSLEMADINIYRLPKTTDHEVLEAQSRPMRLARLRSLQEDAASFKSKYEDEIDQPPDFWLNRLRPKDCQHFIATTTSWSGAEDIEFKALMVVLTDNISNKKHQIPTYHLAAFWVAHELRGQKVGSRMIEESIEWIKEDASMKGWTQIRYRLGVEPNNDRAIKFYTRLGFSMVSRGSENDDDGFEDDFFEMRMSIDVS